MIQLLIIFVAAIVISLVIAFLRIAVEDASVKIKENKGDKSILSWLFLYPLFNGFSVWIEKFRLWIVSLGNFFIGVIQFIFGSAILATIVYLIYRLIKAIF